MLPGQRKLEKNWKTGNAKMSKVPHLDQLPRSDLIKMDSTLIAIGSSSGNIQTFNRKPLSREKVLLHCSNAMILFTINRFWIKYFLSLLSYH